MLGLEKLDFGREDYETKYMIMGPLKNPVRFMLKKLLLKKSIKLSAIRGIPKLKKVFNFSLLGFKKFKNIIFL